MSRYIDTDTYIKYCDDHWIPLNVDAVNAQPTADVEEVVHGEWIMINEQLAKCSVCGGYESTNGRDLTMKGIIFKEIKPYCPHCGADMRGDKE